MPRCNCNNTFAMSLLIVSSVALCSAAPPDKQENAAPNSAPSTRASAIHTLELFQWDDYNIFLVDPGMTVKIDLPGNYTTAYQWRLHELKNKPTDADPKKKIVLQQVGKIEYRPHDTAKDGAGGTFTIKLEAINPGMAMVTLHHSRGEEPTRTFSVMIQVREPNPIPLTVATQEVYETNSGQTIPVVKGREIKIKLPGNIATGFAWTVFSLTNSTAGKTVFKQVGKIEYVDDEDGVPIRVGHGGTFICTLKALEVGKGNIDLHYSRINAPPKKGVTFHIKVIEPGN